MKGPGISSCQRCTNPELFSLHLHVYLDDWLLRHHHHETLLKVIPQIVDFLQSLGWEVNFQLVVSDPESEFRLSGSLFSVGPRCSSPSRPSVGRVTAGVVQFVLRKVVNSEKFTKPPRSCKFPCTDGRSRKIAHVSYSFLAKLLVGSLSSLHRSSTTGKQAVGLPRPLDGCRLATPRSTFTITGSRLLPVHRQFAGNVGGKPQWDRRSPTSGGNQTRVSISITWSGRH